MSALNIIKILMPFYVLLSSPNLLIHFKFQNIIEIKYIIYPNICMLDSMAE
jgi:hypothetical protein